MKAPWHGYDFTIDMTHLAPGEKLSEVELLKKLAISQWQSIAHLVGRPTQEIASDDGERLYGSLIDVELGVGNTSMDALGEGVHCHVRNRVSVFAKRFIEGFFVFGPDAPDDALLEKIETKADLEALGLPWAYMTNAFIARIGGNTKLKIYKPSGIESLPYDELEQSPAGIEDQRRVQSTGVIEDFGDTDEGQPLGEGTVTYEVVPESDLNGAGLILFARYAAITSYGERKLLTEAMSPPLSAPLVSCLSTEARKIYYFANAAPSDEIDIALEVEMLPPGPSPGPRYRVPFRLVFRADLYRSSDKVLIASSLVRKALHVPADQKAVLMEAERFLART